MVRGGGLAGSGCSQDLAGWAHAAGGARRVTDMPSGGHSGAAEAPGFEPESRPGRFPGEGDGGEAAWVGLEVFGPLKVKGTMKHLAEPGLETEPHTVTATDG